MARANLASSLTPLGSDINAEKTAVARCATVQAPMVGGGPAPNKNMTFASHRSKACASQ